MDSACSMDGEHNKLLQFFIKKTWKEGSTSMPNRKCKSNIEIGQQEVGC